MKKLLSFVCVVAMLLTFASFPTFAQEKTGTVGLYPKYPEFVENADGTKGDVLLPRDYDYEVWINDGVTDYSIPVYNATRHKNPYVTTNDKTDDYRRFCEFSFEGEVTLNIKVKGDMESYAVLPSSQKTSQKRESSYSNGVISIPLYESTSSQNFLIRLNEDQNTILSIFADPLWDESEVPTQSTTDSDLTNNNVIVFGAGVNNIESGGTEGTNYRITADGEFAVTSNTTVYLKPGALVTYRFSVIESQYISSTSYIYYATKESDIKIDGRGAFIDPRTDRTADETFMFYSSNDTNVTIKNVKFLDAHCFNICYDKTSGVLIDNVKMLSSEISSDGVSFWGASGNVGEVKNSFMYVNDNAFVVSSADGIKVENCIVGTGFGIVFPQGTVDDFTVDGLDIFRMGDFFRARITSVGDCTWNITVKNIRAEDALKASAFISLKGQGAGAKNVTFENVSLPDGSANQSSSRYVRNEATYTTNTTFTLKDVFIGGTKITRASTTWSEVGEDGLFFGGSVPDNLTFNYNNSSVTLESIGGGTYSKNTVSSHSPTPNILVGEGFTIPYYEIDVLEQNDLTYIPVAHVLENLGYDVTTSVDGETVTAKDSNTEVTLTSTSASNTTLTEKPIVIDGIMLVPTTLMEEVFGLKCGVSSNGVTVQKNGFDNLLRDGGFEDLDFTIPNSTFSNTNSYAKSFDWTHFYHADTDIITSGARSGSTAMKAGYHSTNTTNGEYRGIAQHIGDVIKTYGKGTYTFSAYVKLDSNVTTADAVLSIGLAQAYYLVEEANSWDNLPLDGFNQLQTYAKSDLSTSDWTLVTKTVTVDDTVLNNADVALFFVGVKEGSKNFDFYIDDASLTFTPTASYSPKIAPYIASAERVAFYEYYGSNVVLNSTKMPEGFTLSIGDRIDIRDALMQKYPNIDLNRVTIKIDDDDKTTYYEKVCQEAIYAPIKGTLKILVSEYFDMEGTKHTVSDTTFATLTVADAYGDVGSQQNSLYDYTKLTDSNAKIVARTTESAITTFRWHGSSAEFKFSGTTLGIETKSKNTQKIIYQIDGGKEQVVSVKGTSTGNDAYTYILADNLSAGEHTVKITKSDESFWGEITLVSAVTGKGTSSSVSKPDQTDKLKIQFIGDSITSGNSLENYTYDYAYLTAKELDADAQMFSVSGAVMSDFLNEKGVRKSQMSPRAFVIPYLYKGVNHGQSDTKGYWNLDTTTYQGTWVNDTEKPKPSYTLGTIYNTQNFIPDIVVINLGTNDESALNSTTYGEDNQKTFVNMYANFLKELSTYYPNAKFVCSYGMMGGNDTVISCIEEAVELYKQKNGTNNIVSLTYSNSTDKAYDKSHPGNVGHATAATALVNKIKTSFVLGDNITLTPDENGDIILPQTPIEDGKLFKGWYKEDGNPFVNGDKVETETITLTPKFIDLAGALTAEINPDGEANTTPGDILIPNNEKYTNGFYYQGIQVRITGKTGLRFIIAKNLSVQKAIEEALPSANFENKFLVALTGSLKGEELTTSNAPINTSVENIYRSSEALTVSGKDAEGYDKFTICVVNIAEDNFETSISVRPYFTYTDASGTTHIIYGEQGECSLFEGANIAVNSGLETKDATNWLLENIIKKCDGDNDDNAGNLFG